MYVRYIHVIDESPYLPFAPGAFSSWGGGGQIPVKPREMHSFLVTSERNTVTVSYQPRPGKTNDSAAVY